MLTRLSTVGHNGPADFQLMASDFDTFVLECVSHAIDDSGRKRNSSPRCACWVEAGTKRYRGGVGGVLLIGEKRFISNQLECRTTDTCRVHVREFDAGTWTTFLHFLNLADLFFRTGGQDH
jgi:hypothetical protein